MSKLPDLNLLTSRQIEEVLKTCDSYLGKKLGLEGAIENTKLPILITSLNLSWDTPDSFENDLNIWTKQKNIRSTYTVLYQVWEQKLGQEKNVEKTTPSKDELEASKKEAERLEEQRVKSTAKSQKDVDEFIKKQKTIAEEAKKAKETLKDKKVYVKVVQPEPAKLTPDEQKAFNNLQSMAKSTPRVLVENITKTIEEKLPETLKQSASPDETHYYAESVAITAVDNLRAGPGSVDKDSVVLASLSNNPSALDKLGISESDKKFIGKASSDMATLKALPYRTNQQILTSIFGNNVTEQILGPDPSTFDVSFTNNPQESTDSVPLDRLAETYQGVAGNPFFSQIQSFGIDKIKGKLIDSGKEKILGQISKLPADSFLGKITASEKFGGIINLLKPSQTIEATNLFGKLVMNFSPEFAPVVSGIGQLIGVDFGLVSVPTIVVATPGFVPLEAVTIGSTFPTTAPIVSATGQVAKKGLGGLNVSLGNAVARGGSALLAKIGLTTASKTLAAMVGTGLAGPLGFIATTLAFELFGKLIEKLGPWIKKHQEDLKIIGGLLLGGGILINSIPMAIIGGLIFTPIAIKTGFSLARIASRTAFFFGRIGASMAITIATPIIVVLVVFPILVAIILFIINSGAYIVPPQSPLAGVITENPYIGIEKKAVPPGPFSNTTQTITYGVTITAKKGNLTNITIADECKAISKGGSIGCPATSLPTPPDSISPSAPFSFSYTTTYDAGTNSDSIMTNVIKVSALAESSQQSANGSVSIIIGSPPSACLSVDGSWPAQFKTIIDNAVATLSSSFPVYMSKVCSSGETISVVFSQTCPLGWNCYGAWYGGKLYLMPMAFSFGDSYVLFTLAHETGHYLQDMTTIGSTLYGEYINTISPPDICSYGNTFPSNNPFGAYSESFAETIGRYASNYPHNCFGGSFKSAYPNNWQFANDKIFK
jgi:hypothetical protein